MVHTRRQRRCARAFIDRQVAEHDDGHVLIVRNQERELGAFLIAVPVGDGVGKAIRSARLNGVIGLRSVSVATVGSHLKGAVCAGKRLRPPTFAEGQGNAVDGRDRCSIGTWGEVQNAFNKGPLRQFT